MDRLIQKQTTALLQIFPWRRTWVPADSAKLIQSPELTLFNATLSLRVSCVKAALKPDLEWNPLLCNFGKRLLCASQFQSYRFLAKNCLPCFCCRFDQSGMGICGSAYDYTVDVTAT